MALKRITLSDDQIREVENVIADLQLNGLNQVEFGNFSQNFQDQIIAQSVENQRLLIKKGLQYDAEQNIDEFFEDLRNIKLIQISDHFNTL